MYQIHTLWLKWITLCSSPQGSFAEVRVYSLGLFAVVSCLKRENYTVPRRGLSLKLPVDPRICLNYLPGAFTTPVMAQTTVWRRFARYPSFSHFPFTFECGTAEIIRSHNWFCRGLWDWGMGKTPGGKFEIRERSQNIGIVPKFRLKKPCCKAEGW